MVYNWVLALVVFCLEVLVFFQGQYSVPFLHSLLQHFSYLLRSQYLFLHVKGVLLAFMLVVMNYLVLTKWSSFLTCQIVETRSNIVSKIFFSLVIDIEVRCFQNFHTWFFCLFLLKYSVLILFLLLHFFVSFFFVVFILFRSCEFVSVSILETNWLFLLFLSVLRLISRVVFMVDRGIS